MKKFLANAGLLCLFSALCLPANATTATFQILADPIYTWTNFALSGDGSVMAANYGGEIFRWTAVGGFQDLGPGDFLDSSIGISRDGSTIVSGHVGLDGFTSPALWNANGVVTDLGHPTDGCYILANSWGSAYGVSANGSIVAGLAWNCSGAEGFVWTAQTGNVSLGHPAGAHSSRASAISADGTTIVGFWEDPTGPRRPVLWKNNTHNLFLGASTLGEAIAVNGDGSKIVGQYIFPNGNGEAFLYSNKSYKLLGTLGQAAGNQSSANSISDNGRVVGWSTNSFGQEAFLYNSASGMKTLASVLEHYGAIIPAGTTLTNALSISADGSTIVGSYVDSQRHVGNWMAHITK